MFHPAEISDDPFLVNHSKIVICACSCHWCCDSWEFFRLSNFSRKSKYRPSNFLFL